MYSTVGFPAFTEWVVLWNCFLNDLNVNNTTVFNFYKKKTVREFYVRIHVTQESGDARLF